MEELNEESSAKIPFNNLYLVSGLVNGNNKFWMYLFTVALVVFAYGSYQLVAMLLPLKAILHENGYSQYEILANTSLLLNSEALGIDRNIVFIIALGMFVAAFVALYVSLRYIHYKPLLSVINGYSHFRTGRLFFAFAVWGGLTIALTGVEYFFNPDNFVFVFNPAGFVFSALIAICLMPIQSGFEELFFRGYLVQGLSQLFRNGLVPMVITSLLFGAAHLDNPEVNQYGTYLMLAYYVSFGLFLGIITLLDEGLELAIGMHVSNNVFSTILVTDKHAVVKSYSVFESKQVNVETELLVWLAMAVLVFFIFKFKYRWKNFKLLFN